MKKMKLMKIYECDICHKEESYIRTCLRCSKEFCYECSKKEAIEYHRGVWYGGSGDGLYCFSCDIELTKSGKDPLHNAYMAIARLRSESKAYSEDFKRRVDSAESELQNLLNRLKP